MNTGRFIMAIISIVVAIIITSTVLIPVIDDADIRTKDYEDNEALNNLYYQSVDSAVIEITTGESFSCTINGTAVTIPDYDFILVSDSLAITKGATADESPINVFDPTNNHFAAVGEGNTATITIANGSYTADFNGTEVTGSIGHALVFAASSSGDFVKCNAAYVNPESDGLVYSGTVLWGAKQGTVAISDLTTGSKTYSLKTITDFVVTSSADSTLTWQVVNNDDGSYSISSLADSSSVTPLSLFVEKEYYILEENSLSGLLNIIPIMVIIAVLLMAVALMRD